MIRANAKQDFGYSPSIELNLHQVAQLLCGEPVAFEIRCEDAFAIHDDCMEGVCEKSFAIPEVHTE